MSIIQSRVTSVNFQIVSRWDNLAIKQSQQRICITLLQLTDGQVDSSACAIAGQQVGISLSQNHSEYPYSLPVHLQLQYACLPDTNSKSLEQKTAQS